MIYFGLLLLIVLQHIFITLQKNTPKTRKIYLWLCGIELFLFLGFRSVSSGYDNLGYAEAFKIAAEGAWYPNPAPWMEYPFILSAKILSLFCSHPQILFLASSAFIVYSGTRLIYKYTTIPWLGVFAWITFGKLMYEADIMRQSIAYSIVFFAFDFIIKRRFVPFCMLVLTAALFHRSALILFVLYPISFIKFTKTNILLIVLAFPILWIAAPLINKLAFIIIPFYDRYLGTEHITDSFKLGSLAKMGISLSIFALGVFALRVKTRVNSAFLTTKEGIIYSTLMMFMLCSALSFAIAFYSRIFERLSQYFTVYNIIAIPQIFMLLGKDRAKRLFLSLMIGLILSYQLVILKYRPDWNLFVPYEPFWENMDCVRTSVYYNRIDYLERR